MDLQERLSLDGKITITYHLNLYSRFKLNKLFITDYSQTHSMRESKLKIENEKKKDAEQSQLLNFV